MRRVYAPLSPNPQTVQSPAVTATVGATPNPALTVGKAVTAGPNPAAAGDVLTYAVTTTNTGNQTVSVITVTDPLIPVLSCTIGGNPAPANIVLAPAQVLICTGSYTVTQADVDAQALGNTATVTGVSPQGTPVSVTGSTTHPVAAAAAAVSVVEVGHQPDNKSGLFQRGRADRLRRGGDKQWQYHAVLGHGDRSAGCAADVHGRAAGTGGDG